MSLPTFTCVWGGIFCYFIHILFIYICTFERKFHAIHIFAFIWKAITHSWERQKFLLLLHILKSNFMPYAPIWEAFSCHFQHPCILAKHFTTYPIHILIINKCFISFRHKETIMVQPKPSVGLKRKPHQHALFFMLSCTQNQRLEFLWLSHIRAFILVHTGCP